MINEIKRDLVNLLKEAVGDTPITYDFLAENTTKGLVITNINVGIEDDLSGDLFFDTITADIMVISPFVNDVNGLTDALLQCTPWGVGWIRGFRFTNASFSGDPATGLHVCTLSVTCEVNRGGDNGTGD